MEPSLLLLFQFLLGLYPMYQFAESPTSKRILHYDLGGQPLASCPRLFDL